MADVEMADGENVKRRGRGFRGDGDREDLLSGKFESVPAESSDNAARSVEGWIIITTNIHDEATEEDLTELFGDFGKVMNLHLNLDRRTGYVKGYALIEYATKGEAEAAIKGTNGTEFLEQTIATDFAFTKAPPGMAGVQGRAAGRPMGNGNGTRRPRSRSPQARV